MAKKEYSIEEQLEYYKKKAAGKSSSHKSSSHTKREKSDKPKKKRSGCTYEADYKDKDGKPTGRPKIWGWRISKQHGFQSFTAYLDKNDGEPRNPKSSESAEGCRVFVVNLTTEGVGETTVTGVYSKKYRKLSITSLGLVANPHADNGGYFGRGGSRFKDKVK